jgi:hypothetical protein
VGRYTSLRFQVEPTDPPPVRDIRWPILVLGICGVVVSVMLFGVYAIVNAASSGSKVPCGSGPGLSPCTSTIFEYVFLVPALVLLVLGVAAIVLVLRGIW